MGGTNGREGRTSEGVMAMATRRSESGGRQGEASNLASPPP